MATHRPVWSAAVCATLLGVATACAAAAENGTDPNLYRYWDVRFGIQGTPTPDVHQREPVGADWNGGDSRGARFGLTALHGRVANDEYLATTYGFSAALANYSLGDGNGFDTSLNQFIVDAYYGWQYGIVNTDNLRGFGEFLPYVGAGFNHMHLDEKGRLGPAVELGIRTGAYLTERNWVAGVVATYVYGESRIKGDVTSLALTTNGLSLGLEVGYRF